MYKYAPSILLALILASTASAQNLRLVTYDFPTSNTDICIAVMEKAARRVGINVHIERRHLDRIHADFQAGLYDGTICFTQDGFSNQSALLVPAPLARDAAHIVTRSDQPHTIQHWNDLDGFTLGIIRGMRFMQIATTGRPHHIVNTVPQLIDMLQLGRIDATFIPENDIKARTRHGDLKGFTVHSPAFIPLSYHLYLRPELKDIADLLQPVLQEMNRNGEIQNLTSTISSSFNVPSPSLPEPDNH